MIPANDFRRQWADVREDTLAAVECVGASGWYILGEELGGFEDALAQSWGMPNAVGVASGLDAIEIALRILGCSRGDRVLTTPVSAFATTLAILKVGAVPVFVDTDENGAINLERCRELLRARAEIRYFVPVHLYGHPLDLGKLAELRSEFGLRVVEDCAQSVGARWHGTFTGTVGDLAAVSFYPTKNLGAMGDGGAILTRDAVFADQARALRDYGQTAKYRHQHLGYNSRLDELQAAVLRRAMLPRLESWTARRRAIADRYLQEIRRVRVANPPEGCEPCWHLFPVFTKSDQRDSLLAHLQAAGVGAAVHYPVAIPDQPAMACAEFELADDCAVARRVCGTEVSLPIHPYIEDREVQQVIDAVNAWSGR